MNPVVAPLAALLHDDGYFANRQRTERAEARHNGSVQADLAR